MKLRFAPSPTGFLHVGGARTAIFNLLHARRHGGIMLLRIEDTDVERSKQHHADQILASLKWLGCEWDEGPIYQSDRLDRYRERALELVAKGLAYRCYCSVDDLEAERRTAEEKGEAFRYPGRCRTRTDAPEGQPFAVRIKVPGEAIEFDDLIRGHVRFEGELLDDFVLLRSDGNPTYHLSVVVDDIDMAITHVARGDDHLSNTPKHVVLFRAFGAEPPTFAHLPLILGSDKKRLSKRTGATSTEEYQKMGILPQALFNFLMLLGWAPGGDREIISREDATAIFDLGDVNKAAAVFDAEKLAWVNGQYLMAMSAAEIVPYLREFLPEAPERDEKLDKLIELYKIRSRTLVELATQIRDYYIADTAVVYEDEAVKKHLKGDDLAGRMRDLRATLAADASFTIESTEAAVRALGEAKGLGAGKYIHPLRVALVGRVSSPPIFDVAVGLGREATLARLDELVRRIESGRVGPGA
ncbi:MAG: glutamate--tRNA ligase [Thermoanaerobaculia bacterium]|jgi:glutamyl-tRNA synthetase